MLVSNSWICITALWVMILLYRISNLYVVCNVFWSSILTRLIHGIFSSCSWWSKLRLSVKCVLEPWTWETWISISWKKKKNCVMQKSFCFCWYELPEYFVSKIHYLFINVDERFVDNHLCSSARQRNISRSLVFLLMWNI